MPLVSRTARRSKPRFTALAVTWLAVLLGCSISTEDIAFIPDEEFRGSGGLPTGTGGGSAQGGGTPSGGAASGGSSPCASNLEGTARCLDAELQTCKSHVYATVETCESAERCNALRQTCLDCAPGSFRCTADTLEQCDLEGSAFELVQTCRRDACVADEHSGFCTVCEPGEALCEPMERLFSGTGTAAGTRSRTHDSLRTCNDHGSGTTALELCDFRAPICDPDERRCLTCTPGKVVCEGSQLLTCSEDGLSYELTEECGHPARCVPQLRRCLPASCQNPGRSPSPSGTVACRGSTGTELSLCAESGAWEILDLCDTVETCESGMAPRRCLDLVDEYCVPGNSKCDGDTLSKCAALSEAESPGPSGAAWFRYATCSEGCTPTGSGLAECAETSGVRPYSDPLVCEPGASGYLDCSGSACQATSCDAGQLCAGSDWGCKNCIPNEFRCESNALVRCNALGTRESLLDNCVDQHCDRFRGACLPAQPGERFCSENVLLRVAADGAPQTVERCGSEALCSAEAGCANPACVIDSRVCGGEDGRQILSCPDGVALQPTGTRCESADRCEDGIGCLSTVRVTAGDAHTCALMMPEDSELGDLGFVKCWGANESGQLGIGARLLGDEPEARPVVFQDAGSGTLTAGARFLTSGLCAGRNFTCADAQLEEGATVVCWGSNAQGQLGIGAQLGSATVANAVGGVVGPVTKGIDLAPRDGKPDPFLGLSSVTCGADFACALDPEGRAWCWGANDVGQLGSGSPSARPSTVAQLVAPDENLVFSNLAAGGRHVCALDPENALWCWGSGARGQLGQPVSEPSAIPLALDLTAISYALGRDFTIVRASRGGRTTSFGSNFFGQLATNDNTASPIPVIADGLSGREIALLFGGPMAAHACALVGPSLSCWGANPLGQLGDGTTTDRYAPVVAMDKNLAELLGVPGSVALGRSHTCAVDDSGGLWCWGGNQRKQLGRSVTEPWTASPTQVLVTRRSNGP